MHKILVAYISRTGMTEKMANFIAEGIRMTGKEVIVRKTTAIGKDSELQGYDGYILGCPTYHRDMTTGMKNFLFLSQKANLVGKIGGAFCSYTHSGESGPMIFDTMQHVFKMDMVDLGPLNLKEEIIDSQEGIQACQAYGKAVAAIQGGQGIVAVEFPCSPEQDIGGAGAIADRVAARPGRPDDQILQPIPVDIAHGAAHGRSVPTPTHREPVDIRAVRSPDVNPRVVSGTVVMKRNDEIQFAIVVDVSEDRARQVRAVQPQLRVHALVGGEVGQGHLLLEPVVGAVSRLGQPIARQ